MRKINIILILMFCAALFPASGVSAKGIKDIKYPPLKDFDIPEPDKIVLDNGMTIYLLEDHSLPKVELLLVIRRCGSYLEPAHLIGLAGMTGQVMRTGGTVGMSGDVMDEELEGIGASVESSIGTVTGLVSANTLSDYAEKVIGIAADVVRNPVFADDKIELARTQEKSAISRRNDEPGDIADREFMKIIYGAESPYARHTEYATIDAITRDDLVMFHKTTVKPNYVQLAVWGDFDKTEMQALLEKYFGDWVRSDMETPPPPEVDYVFRPSVSFIEKTDLNQSTVYLGHIGGKMGDPDYPAIIVMQSVLGDVSGRIFNNVRTRMGLAYSAYGFYTFNYNYPGVFYAYAMTKSESTVAATREMISQIRSMQTNPPSENEMRRAKDGWLNSYVFQFDTKAEIIRRMLSYDYFGLPMDYVQQVKRAVEEVTPQDIMEVAQRRLDPDNLQILVIGKGEDFDEPLTVLGEVSEIDVTIPEPAEEEFAATEGELAEGLALMKKAAAACGGTAEFQKIENMVSNSKVTISMPQGAMTVDVNSVDIMPNISAQTIKTPMGEQVVVYDGTIGWTAMGGQVQAMPAADLEDRKKEAERSIIRLFAHVDDPYYEVAYRGDEEFDGVKAKKLEFLSDGGARFTIYLDPESHRPVGRRHMGQTMTGPGEIVQVYGEYRQYGTIMQPASVSQTAGEMGMEIEVVDLEVNGEVDMTIFDRPEGL